MRILLFSGKGGVGKTSVAAATGVRLAQLGYKTLVMSVDPAHSLGDSFDLDETLFHGSTSEPVQIQPNLWIFEVNIQREIKRHWNEVASYITSVMRTTGLSGVEAEELAIFPGMEELSAMMHINQYRREKQFDIILLDCAPTAESLRFVSLPTTLDWYMKHLFQLERRVIKAVRPVFNKLSPVEAPSDAYFDNIADLFGKIQGIDTVLQDPETTSVRLVTNAEKMVVRETQRAFVYFSLYGLTVDRVIVNRVLPAEVQDPFFSGSRDSQRRILGEIEAYFAPVPVTTVPLLNHEVVGAEGLLEFSARLYPNEEDPSVITRTERPFSFVRTGDHYEVRLHMPFAQKGEIGLFKKGDELVVEIGTLRRHVGLPASMSALSPSRARLEEGILVVEMRSAA
jgi:arsenite/tail-anchored protein-transporting ATPase